jgi:hypothetical protein
MADAAPRPIRHADPDANGFVHIGDVVAGFMVLLCWRILANPRASAATKAQARAWLLDHPEAGQHAKLPPRGDSR